MSEDRRDVLLRAAYDILTKCKDSGYVVDPMSQTAYYDGTHCDGSCLYDDIADALGFDEDQPPLIGDCRACGGTGEGDDFLSCKVCEGTGNNGK